MSECKSSCVTFPETESTSHPSGIHHAGQPRWRKPALIAFSIIAAGIGALFAYGRINPKASARKAKHPRKIASSDRSTTRGNDDTVWIPLREVVHFKERQWFVEELENSRDGDPNAMLRLAKMYLHGQGCEKNVTMAQEWLRRARYLGAMATLEELYAGDDLPLSTKQQALKRYAAKQYGGSGGAVTAAAAGAAAAASAAQAS